VTTAPDRRNRRVLLAQALVLGAVLAAAAVVGWIASQVEVVELLSKAGSSGEPEAEGSAAVTALTQQLERLRPRQPYAVVDSYGNRFTILSKGEVVRESPCSTGTGAVLRDRRTGRLWVFDTPSGEHSISRKVRNPVWIRPDWAFLEEGREPPDDLSERLDDVSLGDFGLYLGDGYIIHGTLFQTLLGQSATHGCIRLGDEDLAYAYEHLPVGTRVFVY
jgi:lipoprotein-anchoring transpeptidase ErfK/SrfK